MIVCITGATGFVGSAVVVAALARGHQVRAFSRHPATMLKASWSAAPGVSVCSLSLHDSKALDAALAGADAVIHLQIAAGGDDAAHARDTIAATEALISAMQRVGVRRLVGVSSFSVYDIGALAAGSLLDESAPLESGAHARDAYARAKLAQDLLFRAAVEKLSVAVLRPGIIYGRGHLWFAELGHALGRLGLVLSQAQELPLIHVENCADALVRAVEGNATGVFNLVDDDRPGVDRYLAATQARQQRLLLRLPFRLLLAVAITLEGLNRFLLGSRIRLPGLLNPTVLVSRFRPLHYSNRAAQELLEWRPLLDFDAALKRS